MRTLIWVDMEGTSRIADHRECWPSYPEYWRTGRAKLSADVAAACRGLRAGGASDIAVLNSHGLGWPNLLPEALDAGAHQVTHDDWRRGFDGVLFLGFHAGAGTRNGFISHTMVPYLRVDLDGRPLTECHIFALATGLPVLGVIGDAALGDQLDRVLDGVAFLAVKAADRRGEARPRFTGEQEAAEAIESFAAAAARRGGRRGAEPTTPYTVRIRVFAPGDDGGEPVHDVSVTGSNWSRDVDGALDEAMGIAVAPYLDLETGLDLSTEAGLAAADPARLSAMHAFMETWAEAVPASVG